MTGLLESLAEGGVSLLKVLVPLILTTSLITAVTSKVLDRASHRNDRVRSGYADATRALVAFGELPYRIRRRTSDDPETLAVLVTRGHDLQETLACNQGWVAGENSVMLKVYLALLSELRAEVGEAANTAWTAPPITHPSDMTLGAAGGLPPMATEDRVNRWATAVSFRFGRRRLWAVNDRVFTWRLRRAGVVV